MNLKRTFSRLGPSTALFGALLLGNSVVLLAQSSPGYHFGITGGVAISTDGGRTAWRSNYEVSGFLSYDGQGPFGGRLEIGYSPGESPSAGPRATQATRKITFGFGDVIFVVRDESIRPYLLFGIGGLHVRANATGIDPFGYIPPYPIHDTQTAFAFNIGGGIAVPLGSRWSAFVEAKYIHGSTTLSDPLFEDGLGLFLVVGGISF